MLKPQKRQVDGGSLSQKSAVQDLRQRHELRRDKYPDMGEFLILGPWSSVMSDELLLLKRVENSQLTQSEYTVLDQYLVAESSRTEGLFGVFDK